MIGRTIATFLRARWGSVAAEYALVLPATLFFTLGAFNLTTVLFAVSALNRTAEAAARYASVQTALNGADPGSAAVQAWAASNYAGPNVSQSFTYAASGCGHTVSAAGTFTLVTGFAQVPLALSTSACFP
jgi:Flp pilus assembly protein TadG